MTCSCNLQLYWHVSMLLAQKNYFPVQNYFIGLVMFNLAMIMFLAVISILSIIILFGCCQMKAAGEIPMQTPGLQYLSSGLCPTTASLPTVLADGWGYFPADPKYQEPVYSAHCLSQLWKNCWQTINKSSSIHRHCQKPKISCPVHAPCMPK